MKESCCDSDDKAEEQNKILKTRSGKLAIYFQYNLRRQSSSLKSINRLHCLFNYYFSTPPFETISVPTLWHPSIFNELYHNLLLLVAILINYLDSIYAAPENADSL
jgi:hypothetical protein